MRPILSFLVLATFGVIGVEAAGIGTEGPHLAQAPAAVRAAPAQSPDAGTSTSSTGTIADKVAGFITEFYLSGEMRSNEELAQLYAPSVAYFDNQVWSRDLILADKRSYYAKWPRRTYKLIRETLLVAQRGANPQILDVTFEYEFDVASSSRVSRGRGRGHLTLDLTLDGGRITRETGTVLARW